MDLTELNIVKNEVAEGVSNNIDRMIVILSGIKENAQKIHTGKSVMLKKDIMPLWESFINLKSQIDRTLTTDLNLLLAISEANRRKYGY